MQHKTMKDGVDDGLGGVATDRIFTECGKNILVYFAKGHIAIFPYNFGQVVFFCTLGTEGCPKLITIYHCRSRSLG